MPFKIIRNDITKVKANAIVNTANPFPTYGDGVDKAIYVAAGKEMLLAERKKIGEISRGEMAVTPAFDLPAKYIIHTVGPTWNGGDEGEADILRACYEKSLNKAKELKCRSVAFPLIATGVYGFPKDMALDIATSVIDEFLKENRMTVILVLFGQKSLDIIRNLGKSIDEYVDSNYVEDKLKEEYAGDLMPCENLAYRQDEEERLRQVYNRERRSRDEEDYLNGQRAGNRRNECFSYEREIIAKTVEPDGIMPTFDSSGKLLLDDFLNNADKSFEVRLFELIDEKGMKPSAVYKAADVSKQSFSNISCQSYIPPKYTVIMFCLVMKCTLEETEDLLHRAGYLLSQSCRPDLIIKACIYNRIYSIPKVDLILYDRGFDTLNKACRAIPARKK